MPVQVPELQQLPPAPQRRLASSEYPVVADTWAAAINPWTVQLNVVTQWVGVCVNAAEDYKTSASGSANLASLAAETAATQAQLATSNGQAQVALAVTARQGSEAARDQAKVYAQAAQAGTVPEPQPNMFLGSDANGKVLWKEAGQAIGDVLFTTKNSTPVGYVLPDTVYSRAAYPELFAIIGTINQYNDAANFSAINPFSGIGFNTSNYGIGAGKDNVWFCVGYLSSETSTSSAGFKSIDGGATWSQVPALSGKRALRSIDTDGKGVWLAASYDGFAYRSTDNGLTWSPEINITGGGTSNPYIVTNREGVWLSNMIGGTACAISIDNGLTWTNNVFSAPHNTITFAGAFYSGTGNTVDRSTDGVNWISTLTASSSFTNVLGNANVAVVQVTGRLLASADNGITWSSILEGTPIFSNQWNVDQNGVIYVRQVNTTAKLSRSKMVKSYDYGNTWIESDVPSGNTAGGLLISKFDNAGNWITVQSATSLWRATRQYNHDVATQFRTPSVKAPKGLKAYIKAKAA